MDLDLNLNLDLDLALDLDLDLDQSSLDLNLDLDLDLDQSSLDLNLALDLDLDQSSLDLNLDLDLALDLDQSSLDLDLDLDLNLDQSSLDLNLDLDRIWILVSPTNFFCISDNNDFKTLYSLFHHWLRGIRPDIFLRLNSSMNPIWRYWRYYFTMIYNIFRSEGKPLWEMILEYLSWGMIDGVLLKSWKKSKFLKLS